MDDFVTVKFHDDSSANNLMELPLEFAEESELLSNCTQVSPIPLPEGITRETIEDTLQIFNDNACIKEFSQDRLLEITIQSNKLDIQIILHLCATEVANRIKSKSPAQIAEMFNLTIDANDPPADFNFRDV